MSKTIDTHICEVTVYTDQALVIRRGVVHLTGEERELVVTQLPVTLRSESVRVSSAGTVAVRLLGVRTERVYEAKPVVQEIAQLSQDIGQLEEQKRQIQDLLSLLNLQRTFVKNLSNQYLERLTRSQTPEPIDLNRIKELLDFVGQQYNDFSSAIAQREKDSQHLSNQLQSLRQQLQQFSSLNTQERLNIIIAVEPSAAGEFELEVSYLVQQASWIPLYDLRFLPAHEKVNLSYLAEVKQTTGEDWQDVVLTLSTAKPGLGTLPPKLTPWYIDVPPPNSPDYKGVRTRGQPESTMPPTPVLNLPFPGTTIAPEATSEADKEFAVAQAALAEIAKQGGIVTFEASRSGKIPSDGAIHKTTIFNDDYSCHIEYIAIPRLINYAYLQATMLNPLSGVTLLTGQANIFRDNTFVGTTQLHHIAPGQEFKLNLGIDEGLKIERDLVERQVDKKLTGNHRRTTYAYRILMTNLRKQSVPLTLIEQLPVSRHEQIKVRLIRANPQIQASEMGILEWSLTLAPLAKEEVYYQFTIEHPPELTPVGLDI
ncbi:MAG TPA: mucoidy inhibitor MuiA family protein [Coleofasciculaceae cyanobacterium]